MFNPNHKHMISKGELENLGFITVLEAFKAEPRKFSSYDTCVIKRWTGIYYTKNLSHEITLISNKVRNRLRILYHQCKS